MVSEEEQNSNYCNSSRRKIFDFLLKKGSPNFVLFKGGDSTISKIPFSMPRALHSDAFACSFKGGLYAKFQTFLKDYLKPLHRLAEEAKLDFEHGTVQDFHFTTNLFKLNYLLKRILVLLHNIVLVLIFQHKNQIFRSK
jgi:hypothetical protein